MEFFSGVSGSVGLRHVEAVQHPLDLGLALLVLPGADDEHAAVRVGPLSYDGDELDVFRSCIRGLQDSACAHERAF